MPDVNEVLELVQGSTKPFDVLLFDENDNPESLAGGDAATLVVKEEIASASNLLLRRSADGNLSINVTASKLTATINQADADALKPGEYVGEAAFRVGGSWFHTSPFKVKILRALAPQTAS